MKSFLSLFSLVIVFGSCTTVYKSGQTPDDVYFSPARQQDEYVRVEKDEDKQYKGSTDNNAYNDDRYLRMKVRNRNRWSYLDDYYRDPYAYSYNRMYYYNDMYGYNPRTYWNNYYNPHFNPVLYVNHRAPVYSRPRIYNLQVFDRLNANTNPKMRGTNNRTYNNTRSAGTNRNTGSDLRNVFRPSMNNTYKPGSSSPNTNSGSGSPSRSSSGSTNAPVRKF